MGYGRKAWEIVGYTFQAETLCPDHIVAQLTANPGDVNHATATIGNAEEHLNLLAKIHRPPIDRQDERSFDSGDFPKVIFSSDTEGETCGACGADL